MTSIAPQIRLKPIAASPYTAPTSRPSIMEASTPDISHPPRSWLSTSILVAPASFDFAQDKPCRLSRGHLALAGGGGGAALAPPWGGGGRPPHDSRRDGGATLFQWIGYIRLALLPASGHTNSFTGLPDLSFCHCARTMEWPTCKPCSLAAVENLVRP